MSNFPPSLTALNHVAPVPRRIRGMKAGETLVDTTRAVYVWEWPHYPQYYLPKADVVMEAFVEGDDITTPQGAGRHLAWKAAAVEGRSPGRLITASALAGVADTVRLAWDALDRWFEEDEEVFVHPRSPYKRVDALRSTRAVRIELDGVVLAEAQGCVMVFETGLPTRYYIDPTNVRYAHLTASSTRSQCPYKGKTGGYWSAQVKGVNVPDIAWSYVFTTAAMTPIAGLVAFLNEKVDIFIDGRPEPRPVTHFS
ncbi:MAG: DUF427 domain-containing protein [Candidatus Lustribacter sp.]|jgi:uncharacterized protein (DUF427 family)